MPIPRWGRAPCPGLLVAASGAPQSQAFDAAVPAGMGDLHMQPEFDGFFNHLITCE